ncbi:MAG: dephospho-CoA kinase [Clostridia bacterium]|nr:dephospho-CoA kinase [Clostridia bacterium]
MLVIGLTGGTGSGKGCVGKRFLSHGIYTIDTDAVSREVCQKGSACLCELVGAFGENILNCDGSLNRKKLAEIAFSDADNHRMLNDITHKHILGRVREWLCERKTQGDFAAIVDAPLLYESSFDQECDIVIAVTAPKETRIDRLRQRDGITDAEIFARMSKQKDDEFYTKNADYVVINDSSVRSLQKQVDSIYSAILQRGTK